MVPVVLEKGIAARAGHFVRLKLGTGSVANDEELGSTTVITSCVG